MGDRVRVSQFVGVWLKCAHRSSGRHCCVVSAASHCGFTAAPDSTVCFQFCKLLLHSLSLAPPPSSGWLTGGTGSFFHSPPPALLVHLAEEVLSGFLANSCRDPCLVLHIRLWCSYIPSVRDGQGYALALGDGFWFLVSSAHRVAFFWDSCCWKLKLWLRTELARWPGYLQVWRCQQP